MTDKVKIGMLCTFKDRNNTAWVGHKLPPNNEHKKTFFDKSNPVIFLGKPFVTILEKKGGKYLNLWISYSKVLGVSKTSGELVKVWVMSSKLKPVKVQRSSQSKDL